MQLNGVKSGNNGKITIAIPNSKNRYFERMKGLLEDCGISFEPRNDRPVQTSNPLYEVMMLAPLDIPKYVAKGTAALGVGSDEFLQETGVSVIKLLDFSFAKVRLSVIAPPEIESLSQLEGKTVGTAVPKIAASYFASMNVNANIEFLRGTLEMACTKWPFVADAIIDQIQTGDTMRDAGLREVAKIMDCRYYLIANRALYEASKANIKPLRTMMESVLSGKERKLLMFNAPAETVEGIEKAMSIGLIPCGESPTRMSLIERGAFAYSIVISGKQLLPVMGELEKLGAMDTVITNIDGYSKGRSFPENQTTVSELYQTIRSRIENPVEGSYTNELLSSPERLYKQFVEEAAEFAEVVEGKWGKYRIRCEAGDLLYVFLVACAKSGIDSKKIEDVAKTVRVDQVPDAAEAYEKLSSRLKKGERIPEEDALEFLRSFRDTLKKNTLDIANVVR